MEAIISHIPAAIPSLQVGVISSLTPVPGVTTSRIRVHTLLLQVPILNLTQAVTLPHQEVILLLHQAATTLRHHLVLTLPPHPVVIPHPQAVILEEAQLVLLLQAVIPEAVQHLVHPPVEIQEVPLLPPHPAVTQADHQHLRPLRVAIQEDLLRLLHLPPLQSRVSMLLED